MFVYSGINCPYCDKPLTENDDLAVCPECGTPHHRSCYLEHGCCANSDKHADGFEWVMPSAPKETADTETAHAHQQAAKNGAAPLRRCPNCGAEASAEDHFCLRCGVVLPREQRMPNFHTPGSFAQDSRSGPASAQAYAAAQRISLDERVDGIPVRDWLVYFGNSAFSFLSAFRRQDLTGKKTGFTFAAFLAPTLYFLYFKAWKMAGLSFALSILLQGPASFFDIFTVSGGYLFGIPVGTLQTVARILSFLYLIFCIFASIYAAYIMRIDGGNKIRKIRRACTNEQEYMEMLTRKKCPSKALIVLLAVYLIALIFMLF